jgi:hypothetical protein
VLTALAKAPQERYPTAAALITATQAALVPGVPTVGDSAGPARPDAAVGATPVDPGTLGGQLSGLRKLLGLSQAQVASWIQGPADEAPPWSAFSTGNTIDGALAPAGNC